MYVKQFRSLNVRVPDPLRPGRHAMEERLLATGATSISHDGKSYKANDDGWIDVPVHVGEDVLKGRYPRGERFLTPEEVGEHVGFGAIKAEEMPGAETPRRRRQSTADRSES